MLGECQLSIFYSDARGIVISINPNFSDKGAVEGVCRGIMASYTTPEAKS